ncbi:Os09g0280101 [Oryza sativa Japonica Group]|uniref:Os09g0280101 protein n=1 Tax=Oryza sativa subsp. japonica TaxID=39947 RepID=A0A0P0XL85_ORYSJ|nr:Os09g0280101 [Oryza sativa Japonica Group]
MRWTGGRIKMEISEILCTLRDMRTQFSENLWAFCKIANYFPLFFLSFFLLPLSFLSPLIARGWLPTESLLRAAAWRFTEVRRRGGLCAARRSGRPSVAWRHGTAGGSARHTGMRRPGAGVAAVRAALGQCARCCEARRCTAVRRRCGEDAAAVRAGWRPCARLREARRLTGEVARVQPAVARGATP